MSLHEASACFQSCYEMIIPADSPFDWLVPRRRYDLSDFVSLKAQMNLASEPGMSHGMLDVDLKARASLACLHRLGAWRAAMRKVDLAWSE